MKNTRIDEEEYLKLLQGMQNSYAPGGLNMERMPYMQGPVSSRYGHDGATLDANLGGVREFNRMPIYNLDPSLAHALQGTEGKAKGPDYLGQIANMTYNRTVGKAPGGGAYVSETISVSYNPGKGASKGK